MILSLTLSKILIFHNTNKTDRIYQNVKDSVNKAIVKYSNHPSIIAIERKIYLFEI